MEPRITCGNERLEPTGVVAVMTCGHWWVYPVRAAPEQMHEISRFNASIACSFCIAEWHARRRVQGRGVALRVN